MKILTYLLVTICFYGYSQSFSFNEILNKTPILKKVNKEYKKYRLQIIFTQIKRDSLGAPIFKDYYYNVDSSNYFYCASLVKLPTAILALEKLKDLKIYSNTIMYTDSANACQHSVKKDTTSYNGLPSISQYIKRMALVSDNDAYGRVYEFLGTDYIHNRLNELGYPNIRIVTRFDGGCEGIQNTTTNPVIFCNKQLIPFLTLPQQISIKEYNHPLGIVKVGRAYINSKNKKINTPKDFTHMNYMSLENCHSILKKIIFNNNLPENKRFDLLEDDRLLLIEQLTMYPSQSKYPTYNPKVYYDSYKKYFLFGNTKEKITNSDIKITNIVGQSYGFMSDCAYIQNKKENIEFMLSAVIYTNHDEIINDGKYEYDTIALPFLAELGRQIYSYELRKK